MLRTLEIDRVGLNGQGVGTDPEGNIYFVPGALPGDFVEVDSFEERKKYRDGELKRILRHSKDRIESPCMHFKDCGGCDFLDWSYEAQVRHKEATLKHVLERSGFEVENFLPIMGAVRTQGYRNRIQVRRQGSKLGFFRKRTHDVVDVEQCCVAENRLNDALSKLRTRSETVADREKIEIWVDSHGETHTLRNRPHGAGGFSQVHPEQNLQLRQVVGKWMEGANTIIELYCGNGNLTQTYVDKVQSVCAVDSNEAALQEARTTFQSFDHLVFLKSNVERVSGKIPQEIRDRCDTLLLDPPRSGVEQGLGPFLMPGLQTLVYVSCSPTAFAQDAQCLKKNFRLAQIQPIDMFPHTRHIEFVAQFLRV